MTVGKRIFTVPLMKSGAYAAALPSECKCARTGEINPKEQKERVE